MLSLLFASLAIIYKRLSKAAQVYGKQYPSLKASVVDLHGIIGLHFKPPMSYWLALCPDTSTESMLSEKFYDDYYAAM